MRLARGTVEGAAELMRRESATSPATLRRNVTSPGGTTAAALAVLQGAEGLDDLHGPRDRRGPRPRGARWRASRGFLGGARLSAYIAGNDQPGGRAMATRPKNEAKSPPPDTRGKIVEALMELAAERRFDDISVRDISKAAGVSLADFRDSFPSKGAVLAGFSRRIDRAVLEQDQASLPMKARASACSTS